jgi:hypothetical protein
MRIRGWYEAGASQMALALTRLMRQLMTHEGPLHLILAGRCLAETLGSTSFRLQLWHDVLKEKASLCRRAAKGNSSGV